METIEGRFEQSQAFLQVADGGSFTRAAVALGRSKAWVSKSVADLERVLGAQLLLRTTRRVALTEAGSVYREYCRQLRETMLEAEQAVSASRTEVAGTLRVTAATSFGEAFMPDLLVAFQARHPRLEIQLDLSVQLRNLLESGFDFGFRSARTVDERLVAKSVGVLRDIPVASPAFLARHGTPRTPADLEALPALRNTRIGGHADWTFSRAGETATIHMQGSFAASHHGPLRRVARLGAGIALLPEFLVADELASGHLVRLLPDYDVAPVPVYLVYAYRRHMPYRNRVFREFAIEWFAAPERAGTFA